MIRFVGCSWRLVTVLLVLSSLALRLSLLFLVCVLVAATCRRVDVHYTCFSSQHTASLSLTDVIGHDSLIDWEQIFNCYSVSEWCVYIHDDTDLWYSGFLICGIHNQSNSRLSVNMWLIPDTSLFLLLSVFVVEFCMSPRAYLCAL